MNALRPSSLHRSWSGFTLVEIMIVVVIIGLLAALGIPAFQRVQQKSRLSAFVNDLRKIEDAIDIYQQEHGSAPPDYNAGVLPTELATYLTKPNFSQPTPLGGLWDWDNHTSYYRISVENMSAGNSQLVDNLLDDGNLSTGKIQDNGHFRYFLWRQ